eukprot:TRINITY_DN16638_c4_g3_i2.p2 TRINITY_DN16638_c4_g3~~TRINITY_DN16638_c4_g3_i2.p2  ORF type:complete len:302 (+),score=88.86 TRINITY_DN16638_c4_g3_i2:73-978(+)
MADEAGGEGVEEAPGAAAPGAEVGSGQPGGEAAAPAPAPAAAAPPDGSREKPGRRPVTNPAGGPRPPQPPRRTMRSPALPPGLQQLDDAEDSPRPVRKVWGCSEHLWKRKGPSEAALALLRQREEEEREARSAKKVAGCSPRLAPKPCVRRENKHQKKQPMGVKQATPLNQRLYYQEVDKERQRAEALHRKFVNVEPTVNKRSQDEVEDTVKRLYMDGCALRAVRRRHLLDKYMHDEAKKLRLSKDDQARSVNRLYQEAAEHQAASIKKSFEQHASSPRRAGGVVRSEADWRKTVARLAGS